MAMADTAGALGALAQGISGYTAGRERAADRRYRDQEMALRARQSEGALQAQQARTALDRDRLGFQREQQSWVREQAKDSKRLGEMEREMHSMGRGYFSTVNGDPELGVRFMNEGRPPDRQVIDASVDSAGNFHWTENTPEGPRNFTKPAKQMRSAAEQAVKGLMESRRIDAYSKSRPTIADPFAEQEGLEELNTYFNVESKNFENPQGISARKRGAIIAGLKEGKSFKRIAESMNLKRRGVDRLKKAEGALKSAESKVAKVKKMATSWRIGRTSSISLEEQNNIDEALVGLEAAKRELKGIQSLMNEDLSQLRYGGASSQPIGQGAIQPAPAATAPVSPQMGRIQAADSIQAFDQGGAPTFQQLDDNADGILDRQDKAVRIALKAIAKEKEQPGSVDPIRLAQARAIEKVFNSQNLKAAERDLAPPQ